MTQSVQQAATDESSGFDLKMYNYYLCHMFVFLNIAKLQLVLDL
jgi:hypothetical protein